MQLLFKQVESAYAVDLFIWDTPCCSQFPTFTFSYPACLVSLIERFVSPGRHWVRTSIMRLLRYGVRPVVRVLGDRDHKLHREIHCPFTATPAGVLLPIDSGLPHITATCFP